MGWRLWSDAACAGRGARLGTEPVAEVRSGRGWGGSVVGSEMWLDLRERPHL